MFLPNDEYQCSEGFGMYKENIKKCEIGLNGYRVVVANGFTKIVLVGSTVVGNDGTEQICSNRVL